jgi:hypothetical protein
MSKHMRSLVSSLTEHLHHAGFCTPARGAPGRTPGNDAACHSIHSNGMNSPSCSASPLQLTHTVDNQGAAPEEVVTT